MMMLFQTPSKCQHRQLHIILTVLSIERSRRYATRGHAQLNPQGCTCEKNIPEPPEKKLMVSLNSRSHIHPIPKGNVSSYCAK